MHNAAFKYLGIDANYRLFEVRPEELEDFLLEDITVQDINGDGVRTKDILGFNVTIPYKERVLKYLQWKSPEVRFTDAVNVVIAKKQNYLKGFNTDGIGFHRHLTKDLKFTISNKKIVILGAGGAAKAVTNQLARKEARAIVIYDIDKDKSLNLAEKINREFPKCNASYVNSIEELDIKNADLLINATPIGMKENDSCLINPEVFHSGLLVYDLIYNPPETKLLKLAKEKGAKVSNGLGMLLYQGVLSFRHFTGQKVTDELIRVMRQALEREVERCTRQ